MKMDDTGDHTITMDVQAQGLEGLKASGDVEALLAAAGETSVIRAVGVIETSRAQAAKVPALEAELADLKAKFDAQEHKSLLTTLRTEGKLTSHMEKMCARMPLDALRDFAAEAEPVHALVAPKTEEPTASTGGGSTVGATHNGKAYDDMKPGERAALKHENPALYDAMRAEYKQRTGKK